MITKKAGTILLNLKTKKIGMIYRKQDASYTFPKGHLEKNETLEECAIRETEEETQRSNHLLINKELDILRYITSKGENVEYHIYLSVDDGPTKKDIPLSDREEFKWFSHEDIEKIVTFQYLIDMWNKVKEPIHKILENNGKLEPSILTDLSICPTCYVKCKRIF